MEKKKILILTPNKNEMCGMYQLAKDLAKELNGDVYIKGEKMQEWEIGLYNQVITFLYPVHKSGKFLKETYGLKWIVYDQKIPPIDKKHFPNFWRRQYMRWFNWRNNESMQGADEDWKLSEREQKPKWNEKTKLRFLAFGDGNIDLTLPYAIYIGRTTDYKNFDWLEKTMEELNILLVHPENVSDDLLCEYLSNAKLLVTASIWEGYGRPVMEAEALGIPAVSYDTGTHRKHTKKGICVPVGDEEAFKRAILKVWKK